MNCRFQSTDNNVSGIFFFVYDAHFNFQEGVVGSEDCLWLSVFTPDLPPGDPTKDASTYDTATLKPVLVWIHGGRGLVGSARTQNYSPK